MEVNQRQISPAMQMQIPAGKADINLADTIPFSSLYLFEFQQSDRKLNLVPSKIIQGNGDLQSRSTRQK